MTECFVKVLTYQSTVNRHMLKDRHSVAIRIFCFSSGNPIGEAGTNLTRLRALRTFTNTTENIRRKTSGLRGRYSVCRLTLDNKQDDKKTQKLQDTGDKVKVKESCLSKCILLFVYALLLMIFCWRLTKINTKQLSGSSRFCIESTLCSFNKYRIPKDNISLIMGINHKQTWYDERYSSNCSSTHML